MEKQQLLPSTAGRPPRRSPRSPLAYILFLTAVAALILLTERFRRWSPRTSSSGSSGLNWKDCGDGLECTRLDVPLNWDDSADQRRVSLNILRRPASNQKDKLGSLYIEPGGPGGPGTGYIRTAGPFFDKLLKGRYDLIGWDPRGVSNTSDHVSCFTSALQQHLYLLNGPGSLDLPANFSSLGDPSLVVEDLERQVRLTDASVTALYQRCQEWTGDQLAFVGTRSVVLDLDALAKAIDGEDARIHYWGMSYGTVVGSYLTSMLPPSRLGKILLDGVVNATMWATPTDHSHPFSGLQDIGLVLESFASSCATAGPACALSHLGSGSSILSNISSLVNSLYHQPRPLPELHDEAPGMVARAMHVRKALFGGAYRVKEWPALAERLEKARKGDLVELVNATLPHLEGSWAKAEQRPDISSSQATVAIRCADAPPPSSPPPSTHLIASDILTALARNSPLVGDQFYDLSFCHRWPVASKSFYNFTAETPMREGKLDTPLLITNQRHDPVTPLAAAGLALERYGRENARLLQQNGDGHCVIGQVSLCTAQIIRAYFLDDELPEAAHIVCEVDEVPFGGPAGVQSSAKVMSAEERELMELWLGTEGLVRGLGR